MQTGQFLRWGFKNVELVADLGEAFIALQAAETFVARNEIVKPIQDKVALALDDMPAFSAGNDQELKAKLATKLEAHYKAKAATAGTVDALAGRNWADMIQKALQLMNLLVPLLTSR